MSSAVTLSRRMSMMSPSMTVLVVFAIGLITDQRYHSELTTMTVEIAPTYARLSGERCEPAPGTVF